MSFLPSHTNEPGVPQAGLPSVVLMVSGYKQGDAINLAIQSAFNQDYKGPLTIILSDDCSPDPDDTFAIMQKAAAEYKGPHKVVLNRNEKNLGIPGHVQHVLGMAGGADYFCRLDGDDYAFPNRTSLMVAALEAHPGANMVTARHYRCEIGDGARPDFSTHVQEGTGEVEVLPGDFHGVNMWGGQVMYRNCVFDKMGRHFVDQREAYGEDHIMEMMCRMYGEIIHIDLELTAYVIHLNNVSTVPQWYLYAPWPEYRANHERRINMFKRRLRMLEWVTSWAEGYSETHGDITPEKRTWLKGHIQYLRDYMPELKRDVGYWERGFFRNLFHWIRHRDVPFKDTLPLHLKWWLVTLRNRLLGRKG